MGIYTHYKNKDICRSRQVGRGTGCGRYALIGAGYNQLTLIAANDAGAIFRTRNQYGDTIMIAPT